MRTHVSTRDENFGHYSINTGVFDRLPKRIRFNPSLLLRIADLNDGFGRLELRWIFMSLLLITCLVDVSLIFAFLIKEETSFATSAEKDRAVMLFIAGLFFLVSECVSFVIADDFFDLKDQEELDSTMIGAERRFREYLLFNIFAMAMDIAFHALTYTNSILQAQIMVIAPLFFFSVGSLLLLEKMYSLSKGTGRYSRDGYILFFSLTIFTGILSLIMQTLIIHNN